MSSLSRPLTVIKKEKNLEPRIKKKLKFSNEIIPLKAAAESMMLMSAQFV